MTVMADKRAAPRVAFGLLVESGMVPAGLAADRRQAPLDARPSAPTARSPATATRARSTRSAPRCRARQSCNGWTFWHVEQRRASSQPIDALAPEASRPRYSGAHDARSSARPASSIRRSAMTARSRGWRAG